jgi:hypothetical protein
MYERLVDVLLFAIDNYVPKSFRKQSFGWSPQTKTAQRNLERLYRRLRARNVDPATNDAYQNLQTKVARLKEADMNDEEARVLRRGKSKAFYSYVNRTLKVKPSIPTLKLSNAQKASEPKEKAEAFSKFFGSVFVDDNGIPPNLGNKTDAQLGTVVFTEEEIVKVMKNIKPSFATGPDGINAFFMKKVSNSIAPVLRNIFNLSMETGVVPALWRKALIVPVPKSRKRSQVSEYRPISQTCVASKVMETIVKEAMVGHLAQHHLLTSNQHGFVKGKSTLTQLLLQEQEISNALNGNHVIDVIYFDYRKAFDTVVHSKLLAKLGVYGFTGNLIKWTENFLSDRLQAVVVDDAQSPFERVKSGVPQGSVLGPLWFLIFVNDLPDRVTHSSIRLSADDTKLMSVIKDRDVDQLVLQEDIDAVYNWSIESQLSLAEQKCKSICLSSTHIAPVAHYTVNGVPLTGVDEIRDLGVIMTSDCKPSTHITTIVKKAQLRTNLFFRSFVTRDPVFLRNMYCTYIRPMVESNTPVWSPWLLRDIDCAESVQRSYTRRALMGHDLSYTERLARMNLETLELRRLKADMVVVYKIFNGYIELDFDTFFTQNQSATRGHSRKLAVTYARVDAAKYAFSRRVVPVWNALPEHAVLAESLPVFKSRLDAIDFAHDVTLRTFLKGSVYRPGAGA